MGKVILIPLSLSLILIFFGCTKTIDSYCLISRPIYMKAQDVEAVSTETLRQIVSHNEVWQSSCSGKSPNHSTTKP